MLFTPAGSSGWGFLLNAVSDFLILSNSFEVLPAESRGSTTQVDFFQRTIAGELVDGLDGAMEKSGGLLACYQLRQFGGLGELRNDLPDLLYLSLQAVETFMDVLKWIVRWSGHCGSF